MPVLTGFLSGHWLPQSDMHLAVDDLGFRHGVTAVERLRTYSRSVFAVDAHLQRWQHSTSQLGIFGLPVGSEIESLLGQLLQRNLDLLELDGDVGITVFATPGLPKASTPTFGMHVNRLDQARNDHRRQSGQPLMVTDVKQPDPDCWPRTIKVRSRVHYYLADSLATRQQNDSVGVLLDNDGSVTETSIANLAIVQGNQIVSPPSDRVLGGITQSVIESIASQQGIGWTKQPISVSQLTQSDEVLMMGTDGGIWFASSVNGKMIRDGNSGPIYSVLRERFDEYVASAPPQ